MGEGARGVAMSGIMKDQSSRIELLRGFRTDFHAGFELMNFISTEFSD